MNFQQLVTTEIGTRAWLSLGALPPRAGYAFAAWLTRLLHRRKRSSLYRTLYDNQRHVLGAGATDEQVDAAVAAVLRHAGIANYDLARTLRGGEQTILDAIELGPEFWPNLNAARATGRGVLICSAHLSNFNLGFFAFALKCDVHVQILSAAVDTGGFKILRDLRNRGMLEDAPIDTASLRRAIHQLRNGGAALTGLDWPLPPKVDGVTFFGARSFLPSSPVRLWLNSDAVLLPLACRWQPERGYYVMAGPHLDLERTGDREGDICHNSARVMAVIEAWIRETPDQWLMYHRVWPEDPPRA